MPRTRRANWESRCRPVLFVLCGPSHAGKSTFAKRHCSGFAVISSDRIRKQLAGGQLHRGHEAGVWRRFEQQKRAALARGRNVVLDACHLSRRARRHALDGSNAQHRKVCLVFDPPLGTVVARCRRTGRLALAEAERMWRAFQESKPTVRELRRLGFDEVHVQGRGGRRRVPLGRQPIGRRWPRSRPG